ncbi:MAG: serine hydrolase domain-containing protein [Rhodothermales bacterium]|nr:serine hydrolase domain-containing protein [Rhodothermales bacterium]
MLRLLLVPAMISVLFAGCSSQEEDDLGPLLLHYEGDVPGAAVLVVQGGEVVLSRTVGLADVEAKRAVTENTNFRLASVTKQFTAAAILRLVEAGSLLLTESLTDVFPDFPSYGSKITVRHLLTHTSGLVSYEGLIPDTATIQVYDADVLEMMKEQTATYFEPGTEYRYSNTGYAILAMIVEARSGRTFSEFAREEIFEPAGMTGTVAFRAGENTVENRAMGYRVDGSQIVPADQSLTSAVLGDGGVYSSIADLKAWDEALDENLVLTEEMIELATTPIALEDGTQVGYGFGWRIDEYWGRRRIHHTGSTSGFRTVIKKFPDDRFTVVVLTNRRDPSVSDLADKLVDLYLLRD